jgi:hypothetical protein
MLQKQLSLFYTISIQAEPQAYVFTMLQSFPMLILPTNFWPMFHFAYKISKIIHRQNDTNMSCSLPMHSKICPRNFDNDVANMLQSMQFKDVCDSFQKKAHSVSKKTDILAWIESNLPYLPQLSIFWC